MKNLFRLLCIAAILTGGAALQGQTNQISWNFDDGNTSFTVINIDGENPSYNLSVTDGILEVQVDKKVNDWSFLQQFNMGLDLSTLPTLQFMVRSNNGANITFTFKDTSEVAEVVKVTHTPTTEAEMEYVFLDLSSSFESNPAFLPSAINELQIEISDGWTVATQDVVYFDFIKLGYTEELGTGGDYYGQDFETGLPSEVTDDTKYTPSVTDGVMKVDVHKQNRWQSFDVGLGAVYDFAANPVVNVKLRSDEPMVLQCFLVDEDGNGFENVFVDAQYDHYDLVDGENEFRQLKVFPDDDFSLVSFDFSGADASIIDLSRIAKITFCANGTAASFDGDFYIDEIEAGKDVSKKAYIGQLDEVSMYTGTTGQQTVLIPEVKHASAITASGAGSLIENVSVDPVTSTTSTENGYQQTYGYTKLHFDIVQDAVGTDTVTLLATGADGFGDGVEKFVLVVTDNMQPEIVSPGNIKAQTNVEKEITLTGIDDGDANVEQSLSFTMSSDNQGVVSDGTFEYKQGYSSAKLKLTAAMAGTANISVVVTDEDGATNNTSFALEVFDELNGVPQVDQAEVYNILNNSGENLITLTGLSDGDNMTQDLTITASSSDTDIIPDPTVNYTQGETEATLSVTPDANQTGTVTVTVVVTDDGGNASNDGNQSVQMQFTINALEPSVTGFTVDLTDADAMSLFGASGTYTLSIVDFDGEKALKIVMNNKSTWDGIVLRPPELNLTDYPLVSYEIYTESADPTLYHWNYYFDVNGNRNILNTNDHKYEAPVGQWTSLSFDYRQEGDMSTNEGAPIDASRIDYLLINMHNSLVGWPFTEISGVCYMRNIKLGDQADVPAPPVYATVGNVPEQNVFVDEESLEVTVSGISNGEGSIEGVTVTASSSTTAVIPDPAMGTLQEDGSMVLTIEPLEVGFTDITVTVEAEGSESASMTFRARVLTDDISEFSTITIDRGTKNQVLKGIGTFYNEPRWVDMFVTDMGASAVRVGIISNQWEPVNDNDDPNVINMDGFNYNAFDWQYMRDLKAAGVEYFILTSWSPPSWMKRSMTTDHTNQAVQWENTDNILEPYYYEEFAESMVAVVRAFKEEADIDLLAIGLQNEPFFNEPYASAILGPDQFHQLIEIVGDRFVEEGLDHVGFYMPEQVFGFTSYSTQDYVTKLRTNSKADSYTEYVAVHGYDGSGVDSDFPSYDGWSSLNSFVSSGDNPKELWMSETHIGYNGFSSAMALAGALHGSLWAGDITLWTNWAFGDMQLTRNEPNSSFYATKQYARYVRPGAVRVDSDSDHARLLVTAYENEDGSFAMVVINSGFTPVTAQLEGSDLPDNYEVIRTSKYENAREVGTYVLSEGAMVFPAQSITTLINYDPVALTMQRPEDVTVNSTDGEQQVIITGISDGAGSVENLTLSYAIENPALIAESSISDITQQGEAVLTFSPATDGNGQTKVVITLSDDQGNVKTDAFYIKVVFVDGVPEIEGRRMRIYPNPATELLNVELPHSEYTGLVIRDISGKTVLEIVPGTDRITMDVSRLSPGVYFVEAESETGRVVERIVIE